MWREVEVSQSGIPRWSDLGARRSSYGNDGGGIELCLTSFSGAGTAAVAVAQ